MPRSSKNRYLAEYSTTIQAMIVVTNAPVVLAESRIAQCGHVNTLCSVHQCSDSPQFGHVAAITQSNVPHYRRAHLMRASA